MSARIDRVEIIKAEGFGLKKDVYLALREEFEDKLMPESTFLEQGSRKACFKEEEDGDFLEMIRFRWHGEGSAHDLPTLIKKILPKFEGSADLVFIYDGEGEDGYRLEDHKVTAHKVVMALGDLVPS